MATIAEQLTENQLEALGQKDIAGALKNTIQARVEQEASASSPFWMWFHRPVEEWEVSPWWSPQRDAELRNFVKLEGNDILAGAVSSMVKKIRSMNWLVDGPKTTVKWGQNLLSEADFGKGWSTFIGKVVEDILCQDRGAFIEVIGGGNPDKALGDRLPDGIAHLDAALCQLTGDPEYPVVFHGAKDGRARKLHESRVIHLVDMESPNESMCGIGWCGVSRTIASSQLLLLLNKYKREKLEDLPPAGLLLLSNIVPKAWEDAQAEYERERRKRGQDIWANVMTFTGIDPQVEAKASFVNFSQLPDHFDEAATVQTYVNIVALSFGADPREFWPAGAGSGLGTATESEVMHQKAKGKGVGDLISSIERAINWKVFPQRLTFAFDNQDSDEDRETAALEDSKVTTIMKMYVPDPATGEMVATRDEVRQMLADNTKYFHEDFLIVDQTTEETEDDTDRMEEDDA